MWWCGVLTGLNKGAFYGFGELVSVTVPESLTSITRSTFTGCKVETVYWNAVDCKNDSFNTIFGSATTAVIGENVEKLSGGLFEDCKNLQSVTFLGNKLTTIGGYAFNGCESLTEITIPSSVYTIKAYAFDGCTGLQSVTFENPDGWTANGEELTLTDTAANAVLLTQTYLSVEWDR